MFRTHQRISGSSLKGTFRVGEEAGGQRKKIQKKQERKKRKKDKKHKRQHEEQQDQEQPKQNKKQKQKGSTGKCSGVRASKENTSSGT